MNGLNRDMKTMDTDLVLRGERSLVKHTASLVTKEKDQLTGMCTTQPIGEMDLHSLEHHVLMSKKRPSSSQREAGIQKSFRAFLLNKTGTVFSFPSSTDSNNPRFKTPTQLTSFPEVIYQKQSGGTCL